MWNEGLLLMHSNNWSQGHRAGMHGSERSDLKQVIDARSERNMQPKVSEKLSAMMASADLSRIRPSELRHIAVQMYQERWITSDVTGTFMMAADHEDDAPFDLISTLKDKLAVAHRPPSGNDLSASIAFYEVGISVATGLRDAIDNLRVRSRIDVNA